MDRYTRRRNSIVFRDYSIAVGIPLALPAVSIAIVVVIVVVAVPAFIASGVVPSFAIKWGNDAAT